MTDKQRLEIVEKLAGVGSYDLKKKKNRNNICDKLSFTKETDKVCYRLFMVVSPKKLNGISLMSSSPFPGSSLCLIADFLTLPQGYIIYDAIRPAPPHR